MQLFQRPLAIAAVHGLREVVDFAPWFEATADIQPADGKRLQLAEVAEDAPWLREISPGRSLAAAPLAARPVVEYLADFCFLLKLAFYNRTELLAREKMFLSLDYILGIRLF